MQRWIDGYCRLLEVLIALLLALMVVLVFGNVVLRYGFNSGITVSEEVSRWLFVWLTFLGAIVALKEHGHLGSDMLVSRLPVWARRSAWCSGQLLMLYITWLLFSGSLGAGQDQLGRRGAGDRRVAGDLLRRRHRLRGLGGGAAAARDLARIDRPAQRGRAGDGQGIRGGRRARGPAGRAGARATPMCPATIDTHRRGTSHDRRHLPRRPARRDGAGHPDRLCAAGLRRGADVSTWTCSTRRSWRRTSSTAPTASRCWRCRSSCWPARS